MLTNLLKYKDYYAHIAFDPSADAFHGRVIGIQDVIDFYGRTPEELREEFKNSVEDYLTWCAEEGTKPEKTWVGKLTIRVDEGALWRHRASAISVLTVSIPIVSPTSGQQSWATLYAHPLPRSRTIPSPSIHQREVCASGATRCLSRRL